MVHSAVVIAPPVSLPTPIVAIWTGAATVGSAKPEWRTLLSGPVPVRMADPDADATGRLALFTAAREALTRLLVEAEGVAREIHTRYAE